MPSGINKCSLKLVSHGCFEQKWPWTEGVSFLLFDATTSACCDAQTGARSFAVLRFSGDKTQKTIKPEIDPTNLEASALRDTFCIVYILIVEPQQFHYIYHNNLLHRFATYL